MKQIFYIGIILFLFVGIIGMFIYTNSRINELQNTLETNNAQINELQNSLEDKDAEIQTLNDYINQLKEEAIPRFNISINGESSRTFEIVNITLPIDSEQKASDLLKQFDTGLYPCNFTQEGNYWLFKKGHECPPDLPYPCGGGCSGKINKINGNIEDFFCIAVA
jgi:hypothetical protein